MGGLTTQQHNSDSDGAADRLRLLTYNIQAGTTTANYRHYVTQGWKQVLPHQGRIANLDAIGQLLTEYDIVGLQEVDDGSLRTGFLNQTQYLAERGGFPFWSHQHNRKVSKLARTCNSLLSRLRPAEVHDHKLPGRIPGRGALAAVYGQAQDPLLVVIVHLALGRRSRRTQLQFLRELIEPFRHVVVMGDMNTPLAQADMQWFVDDAGLHTPGQDHTFPSWRPQRAIDHILLSETLTAESSQVVDLVLSDHLPVSVDIRLPKGFSLSSVQKGAASEIDPQNRQEYAEDPL
ncbi:MAG: endonuclease/exonuclease/phosphatase family protein [Planctomycetota bacterium]|jgi:endonuclease/exonuclease/phosphatase family metal-dependent hydrolase